MTTTDRRAAFVARRLDALVALVRHHPYSDTPTLLSLAEHDAELGGLTSTRLGDMLQELFDAERINRRGSGRHACWYTSGAYEVLAARQREREATGQVERVSVPTPPAPTSKAAPTTSTDGRQLARLAATTPKIEGARLVIGVDHAAGPDESATVVVEVQDGAYMVVDTVDVQPASEPAAPPRASRNGRADPESGTGRMVAYIFAHPYCVSGDIVRDLGLTHSIVSTSLKTHADACREPRISRAMGDDGLYRWFPTASPDVGAERLHVNRATNGTHPRKGVRSDEVNPDSATGRCAAWVVANPGRTAREVGDALGIKASKAATLLALHCGTGRKPRITRTQVDGIYTYSGAEQAGGVNMSPETNDSEQSNTQATDSVGLETAPGLSGVVAPRGVVGVDPSEVAQVASDAPPAGLSDVERTELLSRVLEYVGLNPRCRCGQIGAALRVDRAAVKDLLVASFTLGTVPGLNRMKDPTNSWRYLWFIDEQVEASPADESGVVAPEAPVESDDGAGTSEAVPTAFEAPSEDLQLVADLTKRVMELTERCDGWEEVARSRGFQLDDHKAANLRIRTQLAPLLGLGVNEESADVMVDRFVKDVGEARVWLQRLAFLSADWSIGRVAEEVVRDMDMSVQRMESTKAHAASELARYAAYIDTARAMVLRMLGSHVDVEDQSATLDELLTSLEARVHGLEASYDSGPDRATADRAELTRLVRFLERETRKPREGETPVDTAIRFMLEDAHRLRMVAHLAVGDEVPRG